MRGGPTGLCSQRGSQVTDCPASPPPVDVQLMGDPLGKTKRRLVPVLVALLRVFYKAWGCSTNLFYRIGYASCVSYSHGYYFKKFTNLPVYPGLTNPYQISLKTKYFVFISTFSLFLPKLLGPTWTSECLTVRRYKKTFLSLNFGNCRGHDFGT